MIAWKSQGSPRSQSPAGCRDGGDAGNGEPFVLEGALRLPRRRPGGEDVVGHHEPGTGPPPAEPQHGAGAGTHGPGQVRGPLVRAQTRLVTGHGTALQEGHHDHRVAETTQDTGSVPGHPQ